MTTQEEFAKHQAIQERMVSIAKKMLANKKALQKEIREDLKNPLIKNAIEELKNRSTKITSIYKN
ncbi:hypothetical protein [Arcicella rigui]|uniref:Uncharacterized protein n=1 Tax=Arcicella rigui TaxID=797020 RepID=A0ABU5Q787_9BACT|nr:hypothetical protein [Arcicella rigui]MEA5138427.1 hypothetical protein [Arcicella rigui]